MPEIKWGQRRGFRDHRTKSFIKLFHFLQKWKVLLRRGDVKYLEDMITIMKQWLEMFWSEPTKWKLKACFTEAYISLACVSF